MFNRLFALSIVVMLILFAGIGYYLYQEHTEEIIPSWNALEINETPNAARLNSIKNCCPLRSQWNLPR